MKFVPPVIAMAASGAEEVGGGDEVPNPNFEDMFRNLHLTEEEGAVLDFSEEEDEMAMATAEWSLVGKVLSPVQISAETIRTSMKPAWGNPAGLKIRSIGEKSENKFVADFGCARDMERVLLGAPWMVKKYAVLMQEYDGTQCASDIVFDKMELWARIIDLPLGWMNRTRGARAMEMLGKVQSMDVDKDGKASGAFLRGRIAVDVDKPIRRGILLRLKKNEDPKWFKVQYEKLPYICFSCGKMGHSDLECPSPAVRDDKGKLPYDCQLRAPEERRRRLQSFAGAAAESFGTGASSASRQTGRFSQSESRGSMSGSRRSGSQMDDSEETEVQSPLKNKEGRHTQAATASGVSRSLNLQPDDDGRLDRKRKSEGQSADEEALDLNNPPVGSNALVPVGMVSARVNQMDVEGDGSRDSMLEKLKKQRRGSNSHARSAAAADGSPRRAQ